MAEVRRSLLAPGIFIGLVRLPGEEKGLGHHSWKGGYVVSALPVTPVLCRVSEMSRSWIIDAVLGDLQENLGSHFQKSMCRWYQCDRRWGLN